MFNNLTRKLQISQLLIHTQQSKQLKNGLIWSADPQNIIQYDTQKSRQYLPIIKINEF